MIPDFAKVDQRRYEDEDKSVLKVILLKIKDVADVVSIDVMSIDVVNVIVLIRCAQGI